VRSVLWRSRLGAVERRAWAAMVKGWHGSRLEGHWVARQAEREADRVANAARFELYATKATAAAAAAAAAAAGGGGRQSPNNNSVGATTTWLPTAAPRLPAQLVGGAIPEAARKAQSMPPSPLSAIAAKRADTLRGAREALLAFRGLSPATFAGLPVGGGHGGGSEARNYRLGLSVEPMAVDQAASSLQPEGRVAAGAPGLSFFDISESPGRARGHSPLPGRAGSALVAASGVRSVGMSPPPASSSPGHQGSPTSPLGAMRASIFADSLEAVAEVMVPPSSLLRLPGWQAPAS